MHACGCVSWSYKTYTYISLSSFCLDFFLQECVFFPSSKFSNLTFLNPPRFLIIASSYGAPDTDHVQALPCGEACFVKQYSWYISMMAVRKQSWSVVSRMQVFTCVGGFHNAIYNVFSHYQ